MADDDAGAHHVPLHHGGTMSASEMASLERTLSHVRPDPGWDAEVTTGPEDHRLVGEVLVYMLGLGIFRNHAWRGQENVRPRYWIIRNDKGYYYQVVVAYPLNLRGTLARLNQVMVLNVLRIDPHFVEFGLPLPKGMPTGGGGDDPSAEMSVVGEDEEEAAAADDANGLVISVRVNMYNQPEAQTPAIAVTRLFVMDSYVTHHREPSIQDAMVRKRRDGTYVSNLNSPRTKRRLEKQHHQ